MRIHCICENLPLDLPTFIKGFGNFHSAQHPSITTVALNDNNSQIILYFLRAFLKIYVFVTKCSHHQFVSGTGLSRSWPGRLERLEDTERRGGGQRRDPWIHQPSSTCFQGFTFTVNLQACPTTSETILEEGLSWSPLSDIFFKGPHDTTRYLGF